MMKFVATESMDNSGRIKTVIEEIKSEYPLIEELNLLKIGTACDCVTDKCTNDEKFRRYYYILYIIGPLHVSYNRVFYDMKKDINSEFSNKLYQTLYNDLLMYENGELEKFPKISEYYENLQ